MNRRSFFQLITGFAAGVVTAFAPGKAKSKMTLSQWHKSTPMEFVIQDERDLLEKRTLNWINMGPYKKLHYVTQMDCCYTHKNGKKMRCVVLFENDYLCEDIKIHAASIKRRAIEGGAWYPTKDTKYLIG